MTPAEPARSFGSAVRTRPTISRTHARSLFAIAAAVGALSCGGSSRATPAGTAANQAADPAAEERTVAVVPVVDRSFERTLALPADLIAFQDVAIQARVQGFIHMFAEVRWPARRARSSLFVPPTAVVTTTERTFVVRVQNGVAEWVDVTRGATMGGLVEIFGNVTAGEQVAVRGTDELSAGTPIRAVRQAGK